MTPITPEAEAFRQRLTRDPSLMLSFSELVQFLEASEYQLIELMVHNKIWSGAVPPNPGGTGELEFGLIPYWVNHPPQFILDYLADHKEAKYVWDLLELLLPTRIDTANYNALIAAAEGGGVVAADGTIFGKAKYEQLDPDWVWAAFNYMIVHYLNDRAQFSTKNVKPVPLTGAAPNQVKIALMGDWGTGNYAGGAAADVMEQIVGLSPDYLIHLGDVYYAGTGGDFLPLNEELDNFVKVWPPASTPGIKGSFTLNSNHEMYAGAKGLFGVALKDARFSQQLETSYFALQYGSVNLLGLDSAYFSTSPLFMLGSIGLSTGPQAQWINGLGLSAKSTIVLTHHTGLTYDGSKEQSLWGQIREALGDDPAAWYWGHVHNGIVYKSPTVTGRATYATCLGHGALPFGQAWGLTNAPQVECFSDTINPNAGGVRVYNGFVMLTITSGGLVTEDLYQQDTPNPINTRSYQLPV